MTLSPRFKHALKTALAVVIAYAIALYMDWDKPIWAGWTAASVSLDATGQSIQKGLNRIAGALVGSLAGFILLAFFIQDRWLFFLFFSLWVAICTYFSFGSERYNYFWQQAGFFAVVVGLDSAFSPANAFAIAIERTQGAGNGKHESAFRQQHGSAARQAGRRLSPGCTAGATAAAFRQPAGCGRTRQLGGQCDATRLAALPGADRRSERCAGAMAAGFQ
jgi:hypothetical protein